MGFFACEESNRALNPFHSLSFRVISALVGSYDARTHIDILADRN
jgi:hypothetical protein